MSKITHSIFIVLKGIIKPIKLGNCSVLWVSCFVCSRLWVRSQETFAQLPRFLLTFVRKEHFGQLERLPTSPSDRACVAVRADLSHIRAIGY